MTLPKRMLSLQQKKVGAPLEIVETDVPTPKKGEVLIKLAYSPVNPSDLSMLQGSYAESPEYPLIPGIEGSGTVVANGGGLIAKLRQGKRVSFTSTKGRGGVWSEYVCTSAMHCIPLNNNVCFKQGASLIVNPLTALAFIDIAKKQGSKAIVNTAAASALGKMLVRLAKSEDLPLINIVRKESQATELKELGAKYILNSSEADFGEKFKSLSHQLEATQIFDAVTGELTPILLNNAPKSSTIYLYAKLDDRVMPIDQRQIVQQAKQIKGFFLSEYSQQKGLMKSLADVKKVQKMLGKEIQTTIKEIVSPEQLNNAIEEYKSDMGKGKILLKF